MILVMPLLNLQRQVGVHGSLLEDYRELDFAIGGYSPSSPHYSLQSPSIAWFTPQEPKKDGPVLLSTRKINDDTLDQFRYLLSQQDFSLVSEFCENKDCDNAYATFLDIVKQIYNQSFPLIKKSKKKSSIDQPWMTKALLRSCRKKN